MCYNVSEQYGLFSPILGNIINIYISIYIIIHVQNISHDCTTVLFYNHFYFCIHEDNEKHI